MSQVIVNRGKAGSVLNGQNGSTSGADSNDARFLDWSGENYVYLPGVNGNFLSVPDSAPLDITGDIDIRVQVAMDDWTPATSNFWVAKFSSEAAAQQSYALRLNSSSRIGLTWTTNGTTDINTESTVAPTITDGASLWIRATLDVDNGASGYDAKFFTSPDGVTWTQLGTTVTGAGVTSIFSGTSLVFLGSSGLGGTVGTGKFYRAQIFNGIDGTKVLDVDTSVITTGAATSFTALTGQMITIGRSTSGRKTVAVVSPVWLFGTDDYMEVADSALLDFGATDSFTVVAVVRQWATAATNGLIVNKGFAGVTANAGYSISVPNSTSFRNDVSDGTTRVFRDSTGYTAGTPAQVSLVVNRTAQTLTPYLGTTAFATQSLSAVGSLANAVPLRVGRSSNGTNYADMELLAVLIYRRALTATEISRITTYYQARLS